MSNVRRRLEKMEAKTQVMDQEASDRKAKLQEMQSSTSMGFVHNNKCDKEIIYISCEYSCIMVPTAGQIGIDGSPLVPRIPARPRMLA